MKLHVLTHKSNDVGDFRRTSLVEDLESLLRSRLPTHLKRRYYGNRWSYGAIADELGVCEGTVARWMTQLGLTLRQIAYAATADDAELRVKLPDRTLVKKHPRRKSA